MAHTLKSAIVSINQIDATINTQNLAIDAVRLLYERGVKAHFVLPDVDRGGIHIEGRRSNIDFIITIPASGEVGIIIGDQDWDVPAGSLLEVLNSVIPR